jgi:hypothetical protein
MQIGSTIVPANALLRTSLDGCRAARQNFNVVRIFGFPVQRGFNLQTSAGIYNEQVRCCAANPYLPSTPHGRVCINRKTSRPPLLCAAGLCILVQLLMLLLSF